MLREKAMMARYLKASFFSAGAMAGGQSSGIRDWFRASHSPKS